MSNTESIHTTPRSQKMQAPAGDIRSRRQPVDRNPDARLLARAAAGSEQAFSKLHRRFGASLYNTALRLLHNTDDASEVVQETFLYAWTKMDSYDPSRAAVSTWLGLILRSRCIDRLRRREHQRKMRSSIEREKPPAQCEPKGFDRVEGQQKSRCLSQAMDRLPAAQKQVLELAFYRGLTHREIAAEVGVPLGTIKTRSVLAMDKLHMDLTGQPRRKAA